MIHHIKRTDIDIKKYDLCIENSAQSRIYAFSWYLDIVADNWDVLVLDDYEAVMPIPWKQKYFIKYIVQPHFCQQLGVFSKGVISAEIHKSMIAKIPSKFIKVSLSFNSGSFSTSKMIERKNYILDLNTEYTVLFKSFSKGRKHAIKVGEKNGLLLKKTSSLALIDIQKEFYNYNNFFADRLEVLTSYILKNNKGFILGVFKDEILLGGGVFLQSKTRIIYLFSSFTDQGKKLQASSFLMSRVIKKHQDSNFILDFEGGNLPNIATFFKSFGAKNETYYFFKKTLL